jgi:signal transduction histidine kinase
VLQLTELEVNHFIRETLPTWQQIPAAQDRRIEYVPSSAAITVWVDRDKLNRVMTNLLSNACEAIAPGEVVHCTVATTEAYVTLELHNPGAPISPDILPRLTEPFFSTKPARTGLGLAIVRRIVEAHQGMLSIQSELEIGTIVSIQLPVSAMA